MTPYEIHFVTNGVIVCMVIAGVLLMIGCCVLEHVHDRRSNELGTLHCATRCYSVGESCHKMPMAGGAYAHVPEIFVIVQIIDGNTMLVRPEDWLDRLSVRIGKFFGKEWRV